MVMMLQVKWQLMYLCIFAIATVVVPGSSGFNESLSLESSSPIPAVEAQAPNSVLAQGTLFNGPTVQPPSIKSPPVHQTIQGPIPFLSPIKSTAVPPQNDLKTSVPTQMPHNAAPPLSAVTPNYPYFPAASAPQDSSPPPVADLSHGLAPPLPLIEPPSVAENETSNDSTMTPSAESPHTSAVSPAAKPPEYIPQFPTVEPPETLPLASYAPPPGVSLHDSTMQSPPIHAEAPVNIPQPTVVKPPHGIALPLAVKPPESNPPLPAETPPGLPVLPPAIPPPPDTPTPPSPPNASASPPKPVSPDSPPPTSTVPSNASFLPPSMTPPSSDPPTTFPSPSSPLPPDAFSPPPQLNPPTMSSPPPQLNPPMVSSPPPQINPPMVSSPPPQINPPMASSPPSQINPPIVLSPPPQINPPTESSPPPQLNPPILSSPPPQSNAPMVSSPPPELNPPMISSPPPQLNPPMVFSPPPQSNPPMVSSPPPQLIPPIAISPLPQLNPPNAPIVSSPPPQISPPIVSSPSPQLNPPMVSSPPPELNPPMVSSPPPQINPPLVSSPPPQPNPPMVSSPPRQANPPMVSSPSPQLNPPVVSSSPPQMIPPTVSSPPPQPNPSIVISPPPQLIPPIAPSPPQQSIPLPALPPNSAVPSNATAQPPLIVSPPDSSSPPLAVPPHASAILSPPLPSHASSPLPQLSPSHTSPPPSELPFVSPPRSSIVPRSVPPHPSPPLTPTSPEISSRPSYAPPPSKPSRLSVPPSPVMQQTAPAAPPHSSPPSLTSPEPSPASKSMPEAAPPAHKTISRSQPPASQRIEAPKHSPFTRSNTSGSLPARSPLSSPPENQEISSAPSPLPRAPPGVSETPFTSPKISPSGSSTRNTKKPRAPPTRSLPPPPPNADCAYLTCAEPFTNTPPGSPCGCVWPMQVGLRLSVPLYTFFPLVTQLSREIAAGVFMKQSQVRVMGANAASESEKTIALVNLVPLTEKFDNVTSDLTFERFWHKQVVIDKSIFGDYDVLYVRYPGLPPSPPMAPADMAVINGMPYSVRDPNQSSAHPLGVDVPKQKHKQKLSGIAIVAIVFSAIVGLLICCSVAWVLMFRHKNRDPQSAETPRALPSLARSSGPTGNSIGSGPGSSMSVESSLATYAGSAKTFSTSEIEKATDNLNPSRVIGEGGFGLVYGGVLEDETNVAVKVLKREDQQGGREFLAEVEMLSRLHHRNLVKLLGICTDERLRCLVYELIPNGSVDSHLHGADKEIAPLDWPSRMKIALGAARGLAYLHEDSSPRVIHRDFKSSNILLENDFTPKVSDFGLARSAMDGESRHISTRVMGTFGYVAPEYAMTGHLLVKSDVYSYGVVLLELLTGRKPVDMSQPPGQENLVAWARPFLTTKESLELILDSSLGPDVPLDSVAKVAAIASMCVQPEVSHRPFMGEVVQALKLVSNECDDSKDGDSSPASLENLSVDYEAKGSPVSETNDYMPTKYSPQKYFPTHDIEKGLSVSENFSSSAQVDRQASDSFRRHSASGPLKTVKGRHFWQRIGRQSNGNVSEHGIMYRLWAGSH